MCLPFPSEEHGVWGKADVYMMVRNPFARYVSIYEYLKNPANYSKWGAKEVQGSTWPGWSKDRIGVTSHPLSFPQFLTFLCVERQRYAERRWVKRRGHLDSPRAYRSPWVWLDSLTECKQALSANINAGVGKKHRRGVGLIGLENVWDSLDVIKDRYGIESLWLRRSIQANKTLTYPVGGWPTYYGEGVGLCSADLNLVSVGACLYRAMWPAGKCPSCALAIAKQAIQLGY
jgi:hypothetical protein